MRLKNVDPYRLISETIIYRGQFWRVDRVENETLHLGKHSWNQSKGQLRFDQLAECRRYPSREEIGKRYPFLLRALKSACILTAGEAEGCIQGYIVNGPFCASSEAVAHVGGAARAIDHAIRCRHLVRQEAKRAFERAKELLVQEIQSTNNGKLLKANVPSYLKPWVDKLLQSGFLQNAQFLLYGDAVCLGNVEVATC